MSINQILLHFCQSHNLLNFAIKQDSIAIKRFHPSNSIFIPNFANTPCFWLRFAVNKHTVVWAVVLSSFTNEIKAVVNNFDSSEIGIHIAVKTVSCAKLYDSISYVYVNIHWQNLDFLFS